MTRWPPRGPEAQDETEAHSMPGSASTPGALVNTQGKSGLG